MENFSLYSRTISEYQRRRVHKLNYAFIVFVITDEVLRNNICRELLKLLVNKLNLGY